MRYVLAVAEHENFSLAAQACHVGQPALSQQIAKLEKQLGVALFHRNSRGASLTQAGQEFVNRAREILQLSEALESEMSFYAGLRRGTLDLGIITSLQCINFGGLLSAFCERSLQKRNLPVSSIEYHGVETIDPETNQAVYLPPRKRFWNNPDSRIRKFFRKLKKTK